MILKGVILKGVILETDRLVLDELAVGRDELFIFQLLNEPGFIDNIADRGITDLNAAAGYIAKGPVASYATHGFGLWRVVEKATGEAIGMCGLIRRDGLDDPDVGYAFLSSAEGKGYATEAAAATLDHARRVLGLERIVAITSPTNAASIRVLEKIGLKPAGLIAIPGYAEKSSLFTS